MVLPEPVAILEQSRVNAPPSDGMSMPTFSDCRRFREPDKRLHGFQLAEEKLMLALVGIVPVLQQPLGDAGDARIAGFSPRLHARADLIDQRDLTNIPGSSKALELCDAMT